MSTGNDGWGRVFGAASPRVGAGHLLGAIELNHNDGPWARPDGYQKVNGVLRYSQGDNRNGFSLTGMGYWADWDSTDQVAERAIASGLISRFGFLDGTDGGKTNRQSVAAELQRSMGPSSIRATGFLLHNSLNLFSNFTYFLDDPENGDQFEQAERRTTAGGRVTYRRLGHLFERHTESAIGVQVRRDWLDPVGLYHTVARQRLSTTREDCVGQTMTGVYAQSEIEWARAFRTTLGLRADVYQFSVDVQQPAELGRRVGCAREPEVRRRVRALGWNGALRQRRHGLPQQRRAGRRDLRRSVDGRARRPRDAAGARQGAEFGVRTVRVRGLQSTFRLWYLGIDSELLFVGDAGTTEAGRPSRRVGSSGPTTGGCVPG